MRFAGFQLEQNSMTLDDLERQNAYAVTVDQAVICYWRNVRLMLVLVTNLFYNIYTIKFFSFSCSCLDSNL